MKGLDMGSADSPSRTEDPLVPGSAKTHDECAEIDALRQENAQLRELVIHLSKLVIKKVVETARKPP